MKTEQQDFLLRQRYFIEHLAGVIEKPTNKHNKKIEKLEPLSGGSRARLNSIYTNSYQVGKRSKLINLEP
jgi:hypothetical protein